jgi:hypothetical protein
MKQHKFLADGCYNPKQLKDIPTAYDAAWAKIAPGTGTRPKAVAAARMKLADVVIGIAENGTQAPAEITAAALKIMFQEPTQL